MVSEAVSTLALDALYASELDALDWFRILAPLVPSHNRRNLVREICVT